MENKNRYSFEFNGKHVEIEGTHLYKDDYCTSILDGNELVAVVYSTVFKR